MRLCLLIIVVILPWRSSCAQVVFSASAGVAGSFPAGDFAEQLGEKGVGLGGELGMMIPTCRFSFHGSLSWVKYAHAKENTEYNVGTDFFTSEMVTNHDIVFGHLVMRNYLGAGRFQPYLEGFFGFTYIYTRAELIGLRFNETYNIAKSLFTGDTVFSWGPGAGILVLLRQREPEPEPEPKEEKEEEGRDRWTELRRRRPAGPIAKGIYLDCRVRLVVGGIAEYIRKGTITLQTGDFIYELDRSKTTLLQPYVGVAFRF